MHINIFWILALCQRCNLQTLPPILSIAFLSVNSFLWCSEVFNVIGVQFVCWSGLCVIARKSQPNPMSLFSSQVSNLWSIWFTCVYGARSGSNFIHLNMDIHSPSIICWRSCSFCWMVLPVLLKTIWLHKQGFISGLPAHLTGVQVCH
jgi:hypothetical protein